MTKKKTCKLENPVFEKAPSEELKVKGGSKYPLYEKMKKGSKLKCLGCSGNNPDCKGCQGQGYIIV